jgi:L-lactate dehydrogenase
VPINKALPEGTVDRVSIADRCKRKALTIIDAKGATSFGIGSIVASICSSILFDKHNVRPISHFSEKLGCCLSLPVVLGRKGIVRTIPLPLSEDETLALEKSAESLHEVIEGVKSEFEGKNT